jgi:sigma-70-like protein
VEQGEGVIGFTDRSADRGADVSHQDAHGPALARYATSLSGDSHQAEDVVQEAMLRLCPRREAVRQVRSLSGWPVRVTHNVVIDLARRRAARPADSTPTSSVLTETTDGGAHLPPAAPAPSAAGPSGRLGQVGQHLREHPADPNHRSTFESTTSSLIGGGAGSATRADCRGTTTPGITLAPNVAEGMPMLFTASDGVTYNVTPQYLHDVASRRKNYDVSRITVDPQMVGKSTDAVATRAGEISNLGSRSATPGTGRSLWGF